MHDTIERKAGQSFFIGGPGLFHSRLYDTSLILEEEEKEGRPAKRD
jgi:hypothetical protein